MAAWDFNLQVPAQGPAFTLQGFNALASGVSDFLARQRQSAEEADRLKYENIKNQTIMQNLADNKLITPEQMLEFQQANPKAQKALAEGHTADVAFNLMRQRQTPVAPSFTSIPNPSGGAPRVAFNPGGNPMNESSLQPEPFVPSRPTIPGTPATPGTPQVGAGQGLYENPGQPATPATPPMTGTMVSPNQFVPDKPAEPPLGFAQIALPDGKKVTIVGGSGLKPQVLKDDEGGNVLQITPEIQAAANAAHVIILRQSNGSLIYKDDPSYLIPSKGQHEDSLANLSKDLTAADEVVKREDFPLDVKEQMYTRLGQRLSALSTQKPNAAVTTPNVPRQQLPKVSTVAEALKLPPSTQFIDPSGQIRWTPPGPPR